MFLRLCVVLVLVVVQNALASEPISQFELGLSSYLKNMPSHCEIKSPSMKLAYSCSKVESTLSNPRFYSSVMAGEGGSPAKSNGVNYCYNSLVDLTRNGDQIKINVLRDQGASAYQSEYSTALSAQTERNGTGNYVLALKDLAGGCFGISAGTQSNCGFLTDVTMALELKTDSGAAAHSPTARHNDINRVTPLRRLSNNADRAKVDPAVVKYARARLLDFAKRNMGGGAPPKQLPYPGPVSGAGTAAYKECDQMLIQFENAMQPPAKNDPGEETVLSEFRRRLTVPAGNSLPYSPAGTSGGGGAVREGAGGR